MSENLLPALKGTPTGGIPLLTRTADVTIEGGDDRQVAILRQALTLAPAFPESRPDLTVHFGDTPGGVAGIAAAGGIVLSDSLYSPSYITRVVLHELGHVWDSRFFTSRDRAFIASYLPGEGREWQRGEPWQQPREGWAESFAMLFGIGTLGPWWSNYPVVPAILVYRMVKLRQRTGKMWM